MACSSCGSPSPCSCNTCHSGFSFNWYTTDGLPCNPCSNTQVCKTQHKAFCTYYHGPELTALGLTTNINIELILTQISLAIQTLQNAITQQNLKNANILTALNDLNARLNLEAGTSNPPYTI